MYSVRLALLASLVVATAGTYTLEDLKHVVTTHEKIWIRCTTHPQYTHHIKHDCVYNEIRPFNHSYFLLQHYEVQRTWQHRRYFARLSNGGRGHHGPIMYISTRQGGPGTANTLIFWDPFEHCAVFEQTHSGKKECHMYVWEDRLYQSVPKCEHAYQACARYICPRYTHHCRP
nr:uncharacterized protein LOC126534374 [Dermacentor andersoni]